LVAHPRTRHEGNHLQGVLTPACDPFLEITLGARHPIGHVRKAGNSP